MIKAVIFDRDGTLINFVPYLSKVADVSLYPGVIDACKKLRLADIQLYIATNQSGIGRGFYSDDQYQAVARYIERLFDTHGLTIEKTLYCPFHPDHGVGEYKRHSNDRKPNPGMIQQVMALSGFTSDELVMVGDSFVDVKAAKNAGIRGALVRTGLGASYHDSLIPDYIGQDVLDVVENYILTL